MGTRMAAKKVNSKVLLPFAAWLIGVIIITYLLFVFYTPSPTITATYIVLVLLGLYILWKGNELQKRIRKKISIKRKETSGKGKHEKAGSVLRKRKRGR